jgi:hypothetical protein
MESCWCCCVQYNAAKQNVGCKIIYGSPATEYHCIAKRELWNVGKSVERSMQPVMIFLWGDDCSLPLMGGMPNLTQPVATV